MPDSKHMVEWQPKFVPASPPVGDAIVDGEVDPAALIAAFEEGAIGHRYACHVIEVAGRRPPDQTILHQCIEQLSGPGAQTEFWILGEDEEHTRDHYDAFNHRDAAIRFAPLDPGGDSDDELDPGLRTVARSGCRNRLPAPRGAGLWAGGVDAPEPAYRSRRSRADFPRRWRSR